MRTVCLNENCLLGQTHNSESSSSLMERDEGICDISLYASTASMNSSSSSRVGNVNTKDFFRLDSSPG
mgnify:CR=1 FL=1